MYQRPDTTNVKNHVDCLRESNLRSRVLKLMFQPSRPRLFVYIIYRVILLYHLERIFSAYKVILFLFQYTHLFQIFYCRLVTKIKKCNRKNHILDFELNMSTFCKKGNVKVSSNILNDRKLNISCGYPIIGQLILLTCFIFSVEQCISLFYSQISTYLYFFS